MDSTLVTVLLNTGFGGIVVVLMILGFLIPKPTFTQLTRENERLRTALDTERKRADEASEAGRVTTQLIAAIADLAAQRHQGGPGPPGGRTT